MAKILVLPSEVVGEAESGNSYAFPADNIIMSDKATNVEEAINNKPGEKTAEGGEIFNDYEDNIASGNYSHAEGYQTTASGGYSHAEGIGTTASGDGTTVSGAHAEGQDTTASGISSHSEGWNTEASGTGSHAEGYSTEASGGYSHAEGAYTTASGSNSHAEGEYTIAASEAQHVQGKYNVEDADGIYAHIIGWGENNRNRENIHTITTTGDGWFAGKVSAGTTSVPAEPTEANDLTTKKYVDENSVGKKTDSGGEIFNNATDANMDSHAEGSHTTASGLGSHAEGNSSDAIGNYSHAEGRETEASGVASHAEGYRSNASGDYSHAEGSGIASGDYSHAEGASFATGNYSHTEGIGNTAYTEAQHVEGKYSEPDSEGLYAHIIGWGTSDGDRKNINTIDTNGNGWFSGTVEGANGIKVGPSIITYNEDNQMITFNFE